ncbi:MAG: hypothetical protein LUD50_06365 [Clostridia bacterium]|nr:hypothetical protein [Clostridia bacterium]
MIRYIKCPRCELNYIDADRQEYCDVCIAEMKGSRLQFADLDDDDYGALDEELEEAELCPICGINRLRPGETMCEECRAKQEYEGEDDTQQPDEEEEDELDPDREDEWQRYLDDTEDDDLNVTDEKIKEELEAEFGDDEEEDDFKDEYLEDSDDDGKDSEEDEYDPYLDGKLDDEDDDEDDEDDDDDDDDSDSEDDF